MGHPLGKEYPVLAFCGWGRCGKDTACEWLTRHTPLLFKGGCSWTALDYMSRRLSEEAGRTITKEEAYANRHNDRMKWYTWMNEYREGDPSRLIRDCLAHSDIVCGPRDKKELLAARNEGLLDLIVWVDRDVPEDPTVTYTVEDADIVIRNRSTIPDYVDRLVRLMKALRIPVTWQP